MNERSFERRVAQSIESIGLPTPSDGAIERTISRVSRKRQRPAWLALIKEPPMRHSSHLAVGSPTVRVAAILIATLLLALLVAGAGVAGSRLLAADGTIIVAKDGSGTVETITEAVARAEDGDTILVRPGTYVEAIVIDKDVTVTGDGDPEAVVIEAPEDGPSSPTGAYFGSTPRPDAPYAVLLLDADPTVSGFTIRGQRSLVHANGGSPQVEGLVLLGVGEPFTGNYAPGGILVVGGSTATIRGNTLIGGGGIMAYDWSEPLIEDNVLLDGPHIAGKIGDGAIIRGNEISGAHVEGIAMLEATSARFEGNVIADAPIGISIGMTATSEGIDPVIRGNSIRRAQTAIAVRTGAMPIIEGNVLTDNDVAISIVGSDALVAANELRDNVGGIVVSDGAPTLEGNSITGGTTGISLAGPGAVPTLSGNTVCENETNVSLSFGAEMPDTGGNEVCPDDVIVSRG